MVGKLFSVSLLLLIVLNICRSSDIPYNTNSSFININHTVKPAAEIQNTVPISRHLGREHVSEEPLPSLVHHRDNSTTEHSRNTTTNANNANHSVNDNHATQSMDKTNFPVTKIQVDSTKTVSTSNAVSGLLSTKNIQTTLNTSKLTTTLKPVAKKPLVTIHDDDADNTNSLQSEKNVLPYNLINIDPSLNEKNYKRSNYVVPIVAVILSVPLVAGLISIVYKRGKDWWLHRNYRRMDYLIEGLYNS